MLPSSYSVIACDVIEKQKMCTVKYSSTEIVAALSSPLKSARFHLTDSTDDIP